jgi:alcohol dehydrogenase class IV
MVNSFGFATAKAIFFGKGVVSNLPELLKPYGRKVLLVTGYDVSRHNRILEHLIGSGIKFAHFKVTSEPEISTIEEGILHAREKECGVVAAIGGGSVIDAAKAIAALVPNPGEVTEYLEIIGIGRKPEYKPLPFFAVPTTSGTGSEVTKNAVIKSADEKVKVSLRFNDMFPSVALIDPLLSLSMPPSLTASSGLDALTHLIESYVSNQTNPMVDMLCLEGLKRISKSLVAAWSNGTDSDAREDMAFASMLGGMALANRKLGAIHGFAGPIGGMYNISHGVVCASLMPATIEMNFRKIKESNQPDKLSRYENVARIMTQNPNATISGLVDWTNQINRKFDIPGLNRLGIHPSEYDSIADKAQHSSSMKGNPVTLSQTDLINILKNSE